MSTQRWRAQISVSLVARNQASLLLTESVSLSSVFIRTDAPPEPMSLVRLELRLPPDEVALVVHGMVTNTVASNAHVVPGVEIVFYAKSRDAGARWERFIQYLERTHPQSKERPVLLARDAADPIRALRVRRRLSRGRCRPQRDVPRDSTAVRRRHGRSRHPHRHQVHGGARAGLRRAAASDRRGAGDRAGVPAHDRRDVDASRVVPERKRARSSREGPGRAGAPRPHDDADSPRSVVVRRRPCLASFQRRVVVAASGERMVVSGQERRATNRRLKSAPFLHRGRSAPWRRGSRCRTAFAGSVVRARRNARASRRCTPT